MPIVGRRAIEQPGFLLRFVAVIGVVNGLLLVVLAYAPHVAIAIACHALMAGSVGTLAPAFFAMLSIVAPPRVRAATFSSVALFAIPGIALFLPLIGVISDSFSIQASMLTLVPVTVAAGFILASANKFVVDDIINVNAEALARVAEAEPATDPATEPTAHPG
jgi:MFS family permease